MSELDDRRLLAEYARSDSQEAFAAPVERHINLVYSVALRQVRDSHKALDVTQVVFIILARKAPRLGGKVVLSGWLYQTARLASASFVRAEMRRERWEKEAVMQSAIDNTQTEAGWEKLAPVLDEAMSRLGEKERNAVVLKFFEGRTIPEVAVALAVNEPAAKKRVSRALEKLRKFFAKRGVVVSGAILAAILGENTIQAAPAGAATTISAIAAAKGAAAGLSTLALTRATLKLMAWAKVKTAAAVGAMVVLTTAAAAVAVEEAGHAQPEITAAKQTGGMVMVGQSPDSGKPFEKGAFTAALDADAVARAVMSTSDITDFSDYLNHNYAAATNLGLSTEQTNKLTAVVRDFFATYSLTNLTFEDFLKFQAGSRRYQFYFNGTAGEIMNAMLTNQWDTTNYTLAKAKDYDTTSNLIATYTFTSTNGESIIVMNWAEAQKRRAAWVTNHLTLPPGLTDNEKARRFWEQMMRDEDNERHGAKPSITSVDLPTAKLWIYNGTETNRMASHVGLTMLGMAHGNVDGLIKFADRPEDIVKRNGSYTFVAVSVVCHFNTSDKAGPIVLGLYWSDKEKDWMVCEFIDDAMTGFYLVF